MPVLRRPHEPHGRPRDPALEGWRLRLGQHRRVVRPVQPAQGRPAAPPDQHAPAGEAAHAERPHLHPARLPDDPGDLEAVPAARSGVTLSPRAPRRSAPSGSRSEEHTSELQSLTNLVCRLLLEKKKKKKKKEKKRKKKKRRKKKEKKKKQK